MWLDFLSDCAAILTAVVAVYGYGRFLWERRGRVTKLETFLKAWPTGSLPAAVQVMAKLKMSEQQVFEAAFASAHVEITYAASAEVASSALRLSYVA